VPGIPKGQGSKAIVTYVFDGDTFKTGGGVVCRIDTIDAPETPKTQYNKPGQPYGEESKKTLEQMVLNKEVTFRITRSDTKNNRVICQVEISGKGIDLAMVEQGAAWVYEEFAKDSIRYPKLKEAEEKARKARIGLWKELNPEYPATFRKNQGADKLLDLFKK
jgi:endonuclease YncB( thermonuclease family)